MTVPDAPRGPLDVAIAVFDLSKAGGLERHAIRLADELAGRGHRVTIRTSKGTATATDRFTTEILPGRGFTNHGRMAAFAADLAAGAERFDVVVGFQKLPGLDVLFCCDWSVADRQLPAWKTILPRYRSMLRLEEGCCGPQSGTLLLMLAEPQAEAYRRAWPTIAPRTIVLPPTLDMRRVIAPGTPAERQAWRQALGIDVGSTVWFWLGLQPHVKGLDRAIEALSLSPSAHLVVGGADPASRRTRDALRSARRLGCHERITLSGRLEGDALDRHFRNADLLVHPARLDVTAGVILEALGAGLPVVATRNCGFSVHVEASGAGRVVQAAATPRDIADATAVSPEQLARWSAQARRYVDNADLSSGIRRAAEEIENRARDRSRP